MICSARIQRFRRLAMGLSLVVIWAGSAAQAETSGAELDLGVNSASSGTVAAGIDLALRMAAENPEAGEAALDALASRIDTEASDPAGARRLVARARLQLLVDSGRSGELERALDELGASTTVDPLLPAHSDLLVLQAQLATLQRQGDVAAELAREALILLSARCPAAAVLQVAAPQLEADPLIPELDDLQEFPACDYRAAWQMLRVLDRQAIARGVWAEAQAHARARLQLARAAGDDYRSTMTWTALAFTSASAGEPSPVAEGYSNRARELAERLGDPELRVGVLMNDAAIAALTGDAEGALRRSRSALALARPAGLERIQVGLLNNIADAHLRLGQPRQALQTAEAGLEGARRFGNRRVEIALLGNMGLARIDLGRIAEGRRDLAAAESILDEVGGEGQRVALLREYGEALAAGGDAEAALELFHRERSLSAQITRQNMDAALRELQTSFDAEVRQRDMVLLQDQVATKSAELTSQDLTLRIWLLLLALLALILLLAVQLIRRLRGRERLLRERRERLRQETELDPLTGLGNRRAIIGRIAELSTAGPPEAALLLLDIDRFKAINDSHGHAVGDSVLVEVAHRLGACMRREDLVVRWGGEEFLVLAYACSPDQAVALARRLLERLAGRSVATAAGDLSVSASIGVCMTRLHPQGGVLDWECAVRLADLALYAAKSRGRNRCVAVLGISDASPAALLRAESDFEAAERDGLLQIQSAVQPRLH
ncbi:diguanylate cyclase domain-containing protein [Aquimonas sp.]|jgi:diguanylate cyclase (GGDEF)-like protein|uniref:diguanylate cyclase domain-containing protein n=1 Tax=Aquimonas sp. TaxID=1872588 RepID=UPI0037BE801F